MFKFKKGLKRLTPAILVAVVVTAGLAPAANAATTPNTLSVAPSNPTAAASGDTLTWTESGYQTATAVKCVKVTYSVNADGTGGLPSGMVVSGTANLGGTLLSGGTYVKDDTSAATGTVVYNYSTGITPTTTAKTITFGTITNPTSAGTVYVGVSTYDTAGSGSSGACGGSVLDNPVFAGFVATANTQVGITLQPSFTFSVANQASACNGESNFIGGAGTATAVNLGTGVDGSNYSGGQALTTSGNGAGFAVYVRGTQATQNLRSGGHNWTDVTGTYGTPAVLGAGERFGYTYHDNEATGATTSNPASANFIAMTNATTNQIMGSSSTAADTACISYDAQAGATTQAGTYAATIIYTAVPIF